MKVENQFSQLQRDENVVEVDPPATEVEVYYMIVKLYAAMVKHSLSA
jgi:hypothetical protein